MQTTALAKELPAAFYEKLDQALAQNTKAKDLFFQAVEIGRNAGFDDKTISERAKEYVKDKAPQQTISDWNKSVLPSTVRPRTPTNRIRLTEESSSVAHTNELSSVRDYPKEVYGEPEVAAPKLFEENIRLKNTIMETGPVTADQLKPVNGTNILQWEDETLGSVIRHLQTLGLPLTKRIAKLYVEITN